MSGHHAAQYAFEGLWSILSDSKVNWADPAFDIKKAYAMSLFSALAYEYLPRLEIEYRRRAKVVPCFAYQERLRTQVMFVEERLKHRFDFAEFEMVETDYAVYAIIKIRDLIIIAVRGTVPLYFYDWRIDLSTRKEYFSFGGARGFLHRGFYNETLASAPQLAEVLTRFGAFKSNGADMKVYVTGHSLGGAIAALLHGLWIRDPGTRMVTPAASFLNGASRYVTHSAYTFGMPRVADAEVAHRLRGVYHVRNQYDPVPSLPPSLMGFVSDQSHEEILHPVKISETDPVKAFATLLWIHSLGRARMLKNHAMENYWKDLARTIDIEVPLDLLPPDPTLFGKVKF